MLTLKEFIKKYTGVKCGNTDANFGECVGLAMLWTENLGLAHTWGNAKDIYSNAKTTDFIKIPNSPNAYPVAGDLMCWDSSKGGGYGHIGVITESNADEDTFTVFEQNNPLGSPPKITKYTKWSGVIGWLRPKVLAEQTDDCEKKIKELEKDIQKVTTEKDKYKSEAREGRAEIKELKKQVEERDTLVNNIKEINAELENQLNDCKVENANLRDEISESNKTLGIVKANYTKCKNRLSKCKENKNCTLEDLFEFIKNKILEIWNNVKQTKLK